ncbi:MAG: hypothetical protein HY904_21705 [Deltaproteobacteria bacterium]|nr:hypothetical protein [Deltaproteobacteria bacterium]
MASRANRRSSLYASAVDLFGNWGSAVAAAGLLTPAAPATGDIITGLRELLAGKDPLDLAAALAADPHRVFAAQKRFGGWQAALDAAGLLPLPPPPRGSWVCRVGSVGFAELWAVVTHLCTDRTAVILARRFLEGMLLQEIGRSEGVTRSRIEQIVSRHLDGLEPAFGDVARALMQQLDGVLAQLPAGLSVGELHLVGARRLGEIALAAALAGRAAPDVLEDRISARRPSRS